MEKKLVLFITNTFPYPPGEQFIESEIEHWSCLSSVEVVLMPGSITGTPRTIPSDVKVYGEGSNPNRAAKLIYVSWALTSLLFWRDLFWLIRNEKLSFRSFWGALKSTASTLHWSSRINRIIRFTGHVDVAYCYWNSSSAYGAALVNTKGKISSLITRAHGFDLYEERQSCGYMPLKRQFRNCFDKVYAISDEGRRYLKDVYGFPGHVLDIARLGVGISARQGGSSQDGVIRVVSASFCVPVKRIELIIKSLKLYGTMYSERKIEWFHFGGGPLENNLKEFARESLGTIDNVRYQFHGMVDNAVILRHYEKEPVDIFINVSESEGVPVSIMEAMSYGIPAIAPGVGGVPELVNDQNGVVLNVSCNPADIVSAINMLTDGDRSVYRRAARDKIEKYYCAKDNYAMFVDSAISL